MKVSLVATTQSHISAAIGGLGQPLTPDELLVYIARVSNPSNQLNTNTGPKLLAYCIRHGHWSVFEHAHMTVEIETCLAIAMQLLRHRSFTFQMFSQRYAEVDKLGEMLEPIQLRKKAAGGNRQGSDEEDTVYPYVQDYFQESLERSVLSYKELLHDGIAPESARFVLPQATKTRLYMTGNCRSWIHYLQQRADPHAQREHRDAALQIADIFANVFPTTASALALIKSEKDVQARSEALILYGLARRLGYAEYPHDPNLWMRPLGDGAALDHEQLRAEILNIVTQ